MPQLRGEASYGTMAQSLLRCSNNCPIKSHQGPNQSLFPPSSLTPLTKRPVHQLSPLMSPRLLSVLFKYTAFNPTKENGWRTISFVRGFCKGGVFGNRIKGRRPWSLISLGGKWIGLSFPCWRGLSWGQCEPRGVLSKVSTEGLLSGHISTLSKC